MSQLQTVLWIASVGGVLLFAAIAGLVGLMYLLTAPWWSAWQTRTPEAGIADDPAIDDGSAANRRRAAALAVAVACAEADRSPAFAADDSSNWRLMHRGLRLRQNGRQRGAVAK